MFVCLCVCAYIVLTFVRLYTESRTSSSIAVPTTRMVSCVARPVGSFSKPCVGGRTWRDKDGEPGPKAITANANYPHGTNRTREHDPFWHGQTHNAHLTKAKTANEKQRRNRQRKPHKRFPTIRLPKRLWTSWRNLQGWYRPMCSLIRRPSISCPRRRRPELRTYVSIIIVSNELQGCRFFSHN